jgi:hypothetical protein
LTRWGSIPDTKWELDKAKQARRSLEKVRLKLLSPTLQAMDSSASELGLAVDCLKTLEVGFISGRRLTPEWRRLLELEMMGLRRELREVNALLQGAGKFYQGWARLVATGVEDAPVHYGVAGKPIPPRPQYPSKVVAIG